MSKKISRPCDREHICPEAAALEYILLSASRNRRQLQLFERHFLTCSNCQQRINRLIIFYGILDKELQKPAPARVYRLAAELSVSVQ